MLPHGADGAGSYGLGEGVPSSPLPREGLSDGAGDGLSDGVGEGAGDGLSDGVGEGVGDGVGDGLGEGSGWTKILTSEPGFESLPAGGSCRATKPPPGHCRFS